MGPERTNLRHERAALSPERDDLRRERLIDDRILFKAETLHKKNK